MTAFNEMQAIEYVVIVNPYGVEILFTPTYINCPICGKFVYISLKSCEFYCRNCTMIFWQELQSEESKQKLLDRLTEFLIDQSLLQYISSNMKMSIHDIICQGFYKLYHKIKSYIDRLIKKKKLLLEACQFKITNCKYSLHIDYRERKHNIEHVHFYYGNGKNIQRSIGYKIDDLSPIGEESNKSFKNKKFYDFLNLAKQWHKTIQPRENKTGKEILQDVWSISKSKSFQ